VLQGINVTAEGIGVGVAALGIIAATVRYVVRAELATFKIDIQTWVNGSFMRSKEVGATLDSFSERLDNLQSNGCAHRIDHLK
jgi:Na+-transporting methylmalonyl-CoA/oxaloacetate decarboxylase gamma subunit